MSKHSGYQILTKELSDVLGVENIQVISRHENERLNYIKKHIEIKDKKIIDIGGNTGFFTFEAIKLGALKVDYYEGNPQHAEFVKLGSEFYDQNKISINNEYYTFNISEKKYDIAFCLNVIHHLGSDFSKAQTIDEAKDYMVKCIQNLSYISKKLVFQIGFNWMGDKKFPLFPNGTKREMIEFISRNIKGFWHIENIGIAEKNGSIIYNEINEDNIKRFDCLGEFLNRPIFILKSRKL